MLIDLKTMKTIMKWWGIQGSIRRQSEWGGKERVIIVVFIESNE